MEQAPEAHGPRQLASLSRGGEGVRLDLRAMNGWKRLQRPDPQLPTRSLRAAICAAACVLL